MARKKTWMPMVGVCVDRQTHIALKRKAARESRTVSQTAFLLLRKALKIKGEVRP